MPKFCFLNIVIESSCSKKSCTGSGPISSSQSTSNNPTEGRYLHNFILSLEPFQPVSMMVLLYYTVVIGCSLFTMPEELENSLNEGIVLIY